MLLMTPTLSITFISETYFLQCTSITEKHAIVIAVKDEDFSRDSLVIMHFKTKVTPESASFQLSQSDSIASQMHSMEIQALSPDVHLKKVLLAYTYKLKTSNNLDATSHIYQTMLNTIILGVIILNLLAISLGLHQKAEKKSCGALLYSLNCHIFICSYPHTHLYQYYSFNSSRACHTSL